jgi:uncharacterized membrane protein YfcA
VAVPLLAHFLPLGFVVPWVLVLDTLAAVALAGGRKGRAHADWAEIRWLLPGTLLGIVLGAGVLTNAPQAPLLAALGLFVLAFGLRNVLNIHGDRPIGRGWAVPAGLAGGTIGALFGTGGPPYVIYLSHRLRDKSVLRATFSGLFMLDGGFRVITFGLAGLFWQADMGWAILAGLPLMAGGLYLGHRIHLGLTQRQMMATIGLLLLASGASLLIRAVGGLA